MIISDCIYIYIYIFFALTTQTIKNLPAVWETCVRSLGQEDPLEKGMATHCSILAWKILWREKPGGLHGVTKSWTWLSDWHFHFHTLLFGCVHFSVSHPKMWAWVRNQWLKGLWLQQLSWKPAHDRYLGEDLDGLCYLTIKWATTRGHWQFGQIGGAGGVPQTQGQDCLRKHLDSSLDFCISPRQEDRESMLLLALISGLISLLWMSHWLST